MIQYPRPEIPYSTGEVVKLYLDTFNAPVFGSNPFPKMIINYGKVFQEDEKAIRAHIQSKAQQQELHGLIKQAIELHEQTKFLKKHSSSNEFMTKEVRDALKQCEELVDGIIETINEDLGWCEVTTNSPKSAKFELMKKLVEGLEDDISNNDEVFERMRQTQQKKFEATSEEHLKLLPKKELRMEEFIAIRDYFCGADFERSNPMPMTVPIVSTMLWFVQHVGRKLKWRWFV